MPKFTKGHYLRNIFQNLQKSYSGHRLIITNQFTKFQVTSSSSFLRYFVDKIKIPKITKGHNSVFFKIYSKVNQVVYSLLQIHSPHFTALALIVFEIFC